ncbi:MAG: outer membrane protein assembly factor BamE [Legionella sp.]|nr:MAG: outer membrane protein assembly factor BamE [Legionella sp.]
MAKFFMVGKTMRILILLITLIASFTLTQCASYDFARRVRQQGNLLPQSSINRLKIGMSKEDVAILMGTSLLSPMFNNNRWDYAYSWRKGSGTLTVRNVSLYFNNNTLASIEHKP